MTAPETISLQTARRIAIIKQGLHLRPAETDKNTLKRIIRQIGLLQLDSVNVTARSHYLVMLARAGLYDRADLDALLPERDLFEQWAHVACLIPMEHYPYLAPVIGTRTGDLTRYFKRMGDDPHGLIANVKAAIREEGPLSSADFQTPRQHQGSWWNWKPAKVALEYLFMKGELMASHRVNFRRYYDLAERVLAEQDFTLDKTADDFHAWATLNGLRHRGIGTVTDIADYHRIHKRKAAAILQDAVAGARVLPVEIENVPHAAYIHRDDLPLLAEIAAGQHAPTETVLLSPFDNLLWDRERVEWLFDFHYRIEIYTPVEKRRYGYYVLPVLHGDQLVGRIDPKIDRKKKIFRVKALHLEPDTVITDHLITGLATALHEFMRFHGCDDISLDNASHPDLISALFKALSAL